MGRKGKPKGAPAEAFSTAQWASLSEAFARANVSLGSHRLAERDLLKHMRSGRLATAEQRIAGDGTELFVAVAPSSFAKLVLTARSGDVEIVEIDALIARPSGVEAPTDETGGFRAFYVARSDLDRLYPVAADPAPANAGGAPTRFKPGPRPIKDWRTVVARELIRRAYAGAKKPTPMAMVRFCEKTINHSPDPSDMQKLLKKLL
jgi:hypothetical protein